MFIEGSGKEAGSFSAPLSIIGSQEVMMTSNNPTSSASTSPLYLFAGSGRCEVMGLYLQGDSPNRVQYSANLSTSGHVSEPTIAVATPLFIAGSELFKTINLSITGKDSGGQSKILRIFINGNNPGDHAALPFIVCNQYLGVTDNSPLFIKGLGINPGYFPYEESLGLHIHRDNYDGITLFIQNNNCADSVPFHIIGAPITVNSLPLFVGGYGGYPSRNVSLTISGGVFEEDYSTVTLAMPDVVASGNEVACLYTNGFNY